MIDLSINLTVHNKDFLLEQVLNGITQNTTGDYELVVVLDGCTDRSEEVLDHFIAASSIKIKKLYAPNVFETKANNLAARNSEGDHIIIVQDDMVVREHGWNERMLKPIKAFSDIYAVTARSAYNYVLNPNSSHLKLSKEEDLKIDYCWSDITTTIDVAEQKNGLPRNVFAIRNSVNRGPLLIRHDIFQAVGYLNEDFAPQDQDDADLNYRVLKKFGLHSGCYWIDFASETQWGGTRPDGYNPANWLLKAHHKNTRHLAEHHMDILTSRRIVENRLLD